MMGFELQRRRGPFDRRFAPITSSSIWKRCWASAARAGADAQGDGRMRGHRRGARIAQGGESVDEILAALSKRISHAGQVNHPGRRDVSAADRGAPPLRLPLHAALAHRADRPNHAPADFRGDGRAADARSDSGSQDLRSRDGLGRVPGRGMPAARRQAGAGVERHGGIPKIPPDEDPHLYARRMVAQTMPVRRGQESVRGRSGQALALADDPGARPSVHVSRSCARDVAIRWSA